MSRPWPLRVIYLRPGTANPHGRTVIYIRQLDWWVKGWVKESQEWLGRVHGPNGHQHWIKASDLRPASSSEP